MSGTINKLGKLYQGQRKALPLGCKNYAVTAGADSAEA